MYARRLRDVYRYPTGEKIRDFHIPLTVEDYRTVFRAYLQDPDLQDARARWPFVCMWDNHEFSGRGWQGLMRFDDVRRGQTRKVAAAQAWFEFQPARVVDPRGQRLTEFVAPAVRDAPVERLDDHGLGQEPNNLAAIHALKLQRPLRWGAHSISSSPTTARTRWKRRWPVPPVIRSRARRTPSSSPRRSFPSSTPGGRGARAHPARGHAAAGDEEGLTSISARGSPCRSSTCRRS